MNITMQPMLCEINTFIYRLSKISNAPRTTVIDVCSGKSDVEGYTTKIVVQLSRA